MAVEQAIESAAPSRTGPAWIVNFLGFLVWLSARAIYSTLRMREENSEGYRSAVESGTGAILVSWHGRTLIPANLYSGRGYWALISLSRDGEVQNNIFRRFGYQTIRGSSGRGGVRAALQLAKKIKEGGVLAFTPDGPRGPTRKVQGGTIFLAQRSGKPIIPLGISANPRKLLRSWDSYLIPFPFARAAVITGDPIHVPSEATDEEIAAITLKLEHAIDDLESKAERLVGASTAP